MKLFQELLFPSYLRMNVAAAVVGGSVAGGLISASGAKSAARSQERSAEQANETQRYMYDQTRADNAPFRQTGVAANNRLAYLLGLGAPSISSGNLFDTSQDQWAPNSDLYASSPEYKQAYDKFIAAHQAKYRTAPATSKGSNLGMAEQQLKGYGFDLGKYNDSQASTGGEYGSLLKNFDENDLNNDVVYKTGIDYAMQQGEQGVNRIAAASGSQLSGATLKALQRSGANIGNQYAGDAYNRYNTNQTNTYNRLAGISGAGQQATAQVGAAGANAANQISQNQIGVGNARGASAIAQGNAINSGIGQGINAYQQQNYLNSLSGYGSAPYNVNGASSGQF